MGQRASQRASGGDKSGGRRLPVAGGPAAGRRDAARNPPTPHAHTHTHIQGVANVEWRTHLAREEEAGHPHKLPAQRLVVRRRQVRLPAGRPHRGAPGFEPVAFRSRARRPDHVCAQLPLWGGAFRPPFPPAAIADGLAVKSPLVPANRIHARWSQHPDRLSPPAHTVTVFAGRVVGLTCMLTALCIWGVLDWGWFGPVKGAGSFDTLAWCVIQGAYGRIWEIKKCA